MAANSRVMALAPQIDHGSAAAAVRQPVQRWAAHIGLSKRATNCEARRDRRGAAAPTGQVYASVRSITAGARSPGHSLMHMPRHVGFCRCLPLSMHYQGINAHVHAAQLTGGFRLRIMRDRSEILTHSGKCGCRAAHASMAHEMARSSCCPGGHV